LFIVVLAPFCILLGSKEPSLSSGPPLSLVVLHS